jgi:hypothetical protein
MANVKTPTSLFLLIFIEAHFDKLCPWELWVAVSHLPNTCGNASILSASESSWKRRGHQLCLEDIADVMTENPEVLIFGIGASGLVRVLPEAKQSLAGHCIKLIAGPTSEACNIYNQLCHSQRVIAALPS